MKNNKGFEKAWATVFALISLTLFVSLCFTPEWTLLSSILMIMFYGLFSFIITCLLNWMGFVDMFFPNQADERVRIALPSRLAPQEEDDGEHERERLEDFDRRLRQGRRM